ncbi:MAG: oxidoreductase [Gammaproteobacteria bacterium]|nr:oxidoreductase [Gammaproteobacteria bacterium]
MIKVGIIGYGYAANTFHIPLILHTDSMQLTAISSSQSEAVKEKHPEITLYETAESLITSGLINLVVITAPNDYHFPLAKLSLENNVNVVLEKPMTNTADEARQLLQLADSRGLLLSVFHNRRWDGDYLTVQKILQHKKLGEVKYFESHFDRFRPIVRHRWREVAGISSGTWYDLGSHLLDQVVQLFGTPHSLTARCLLTRENSKTTDYFHTLLHYDDLEVVLHSSSFANTPNQRFRIEGTKGSYIKYGFDVQEKQLKNGLTPINSQYGCDNKEQYGKIYSDSKVNIVKTATGCYQQYYQGIANAIENNMPNPVTANDAIITLKLLEIAEQSSRLGKTLSISID